jgi:hypothetical protein
MKDSAMGMRWLKFNTVGGMGILIQLRVLAFLTEALRVPYLVATAVAMETAILHNFIWHERFTWAESGGVCSEYGGVAHTQDSASLIFSKLLTARKVRTGRPDEGANHSSGVRSVTTLVAASDPERIQSGTPIPP